MGKLFEIAAVITGLLGAVVCLLAAISRVSGNFLIANFESMTLFVGGIGLMVFSALLKLELIHSLLKNSR